MKDKSDYIDIKKKVVERTGISDEKVSYILKYFKIGLNEIFKDYKSFKSRFVTLKRFVKRINN